MSYSIMCPFKDEKDRDKMLKFLKENYKSLNQLLSVEKESALEGPTKELSYCTEENIPVIGFNYGTGCEDERAYAFIICYWISITLGNQKDVKSNGLEYKNCPYIIYDGNEEWPLFVGKNSPNNHFVLVNEHGFKPIKKLDNNLILKIIFRKGNKLIDRVNHLIENELIRMTNLYKEL